MIVYSFVLEYQVIMKKKGTLSNNSAATFFNIKAIITQAFIDDILT